jgi:hypothetical protein
MHHLSHFNFMAILVAALIQFFLGALWYSLFFVKPWMALTGHVKSADGGRPKGAVTSMVVSFFGGLVLSFILAHVVIWSGAEGLHRGIFVGFVCWLGFVAMPLLSETMYERRPYKLLAINAGYWLTSLLISGAVLACWR